MKFSAIKYLYYLILLVSQCSAFCFYNDQTEVKNIFSLRQLGLNTGGNFFSRFSYKTLNPGESACCSYKNSDCNKSGNPDDLVKVIVIEKDTNDSDGSPFALIFPAGGAVRFTNLRFEVYNPDGTRCENYKITRTDYS